MEVVNIEELLAKGEYLIYRVDIYMSYCVRYDVLTEDERRYNWFYLWELSGEVK